jgi:cytochrome c oxidase subunit IV
MQAHDRLHGEQAGHAAAVPHHHVNYYAIFFTLVILTVVTVAVAFLKIHQEWVKVLLALTIASIKAGFVAIFFMHLKFEGKLIYIIVFVPLTLTVILVAALFPDIVMTMHRGLIYAVPKIIGH